METRPLYISRGDGEEKEQPSAANGGHRQASLMRTGVIPSRALET